MIKLKLLIAIALLFGVNQGFAQQKIEFLHSKTAWNNSFEKVVYFHIKGILDNEHAEQIVKFLEKDENLSNIRIFIDVDNKYRCQVNFGKGVNGEYIRKLLILKEVDIDTESNLIKIK